MSRELDEEMGRRTIHLTGDGAEEMAQITFDVRTYSIWLGPSLGFGTLSIAYPAFIVCFGDKNHRCTFRFVDAEELPESVWDAAARAANVFVHASRYPWYVDLLRNEKPVYCTIDTSRPKHSRLSSGTEPAGEGEQVIRI